MILKGKASSSKLPKAQELTSHLSLILCKKKVMFQQGYFITIIAK
jgi:hypothetical protein